MRFDKPVCERTPALMLSRQQFSRDFSNYSRGNLNKHSLTKLLVNGGIFKNTLVRGDSFCKEIVELNKFSYIWTKPTKTQPQNFVLTTSSVVYEQLCSCFIFKLTITELYLQRRLNLSQSI